MAVTHQSPDSYILEISKRHDVLQMALYRQDEYLSTLRHYTQIRFSEAEIESFTREMMALLLRAERSSAVDNRATLDDLRKIGQLLWDQLLTRPVKDRIKALADAHLIISIDEELVAIPWELFFTGDEFLCLWCNMGRVVKTKQELVPARYRSLSGPPKMLILANPTNDLPSSYAEGLAIKNNLDRRRQEITIDFKSTEIDLRYVKKNVRDYDIVHFAGHCGFDRRDPGQSGWVLRDGLFSITDIFSLGETSALPSLIF
nr:CHAT domain-containing protein [Candidatus Omnitrophota bacterium]